jgi:hypothetical protein
MLLRLSRLIAALGVAALLLFHCWILFERIQDHSISRPGVMVHWLLAAGLLSAALIYRRLGFSLIRGKKAGVFWALVLLLHMASGGALPETVQQGLVQAGHASMDYLLPSLLGLGIFLGFAISSGRTSFECPLAKWKLEFNPLPAGSTSVVFLLFSRPPPKCSL